MSFYDTLKSLVDKVFMPRRARKGSHRVGDPCRMPFRWGDYLYSNFKTRDCPVNPLLLFYYYILVMISLKHYVYAGSKDKFYCKIIDDNIVYMQKCLIQIFLDLFGLVTSWGSSNYHSSFSPISSPCERL